MSPFAYLGEFHEAFDPHRSSSPQLPPSDVLAVRRRLLDDEMQELPHAVQQQDLVAIAHDLADVVCVTFGTALAYGIDLDAVLAELHGSNMRKLGLTGDRCY